MSRISIANPVFKGNEKKYLNECIDTGWVSANGKFIDEFEKKFAEFVGSKYALSCANGTVSLHLIMLALGIKEGDEVIMPTLTYIATANSVKYCGATPIFVDCLEDTFNMDPKDIENKITEKTKAIMPVHLYGLSADMDPILEIAKKYNLVVIEDAAEAHGAKYKGKTVGSIGHVGSFSFFGNKIITCGEGGMVTTDDEELYNKMKALKAQGVDPNKRYWHNMVAYNYRMTNMQAAVGLGQLECIDWHLKERKRVAELYKKYFSGHSDYVRMQATPDNCEHVFWMNNIVLSDKVKMSRDDVMQEMETKYDVEMRPFFYPMHIMPPYYDESVKCPVSESISERGISLPSHALLTEEDVKYICESMVSIITRN